MATPEQRSRAASLAANVSWAKTPHRGERTEAARRALEQRWEREVDPDGEMEPDQRRLAAKAARRAYYQRLSRAGNRAQSEKRSA